jgi:D-tyrosyl-tRNA(Tyr) deacylase
MRVTIQRVNKASVVVDGEIKGTIPKGLLVFVGVSEDDTEEDVHWLSKKITQLRIFADEQGKMNRSIVGIGYDVLLISQFTLFASIKNGNRPSYTRSAEPDVAIPLYEKFHQSLEELLGKEVPTGEFGADMKISSVNDGPVTINIDSKIRE